MQAIATNGVEWSVCVSACLLVIYVHEPCENCWTDRHAVWETDSCGSWEPYIRWELSSDKSIRRCEAWQ